MICVSLHYDNDTLWHVKVEGHSGYAEHGSDIICAAVSILVINTVNAIETFTDEKICMKKLDSSKGVFDFEIPKAKQGNPCKEANLLLEAMILGLYTIKETYGENYIQIKTMRR